MTKNVEFSLDVNGVLPTDGCIVVIPRSKNHIVTNLVSLGMKTAEAIESACYYLLAILNSTLTEFLLKSTADFWQGNYYQVREGFLRGIPIRLPSKSCFREISRIVKLAKMIALGKDSIEEIENLLFKLYKQESAKNEIRRFLATRS